MKKSTLVILLVFFGIQAFAQSDIIYTSKDGIIIFECKINEVKNGNMVYYTKDSISDVVEAVAITKDGNYIDLTKFVNILKGSESKPEITPQSGSYKGHDYNYYNRLYRRAKKSANFGSFMTIIGLGGSIAGSVMTLDDDSNNDEAALIATIAGAVFFNIGLPVWISSGVKKANNKRAMEMANRNAHLSFCATNNGVGLVLNF